MTQAARRLYTSDGTMVLNVDDLIEWAKNSYVKAEKRRLQREAHGGENSSSTTDKHGSLNIESCVPGFIYFIANFYVI